MAVEREQRSVELRSTVSEQSPAGSAGGDLVQIEGGGQNDSVLVLYASLLSLTTTGVGHDGTGGVGDEGGSVEADEALVAQLLAHTVARHHGDVVGGGVALHRASPVTAAVQAGVLRLRTDGSGVHYR